MSSVLLLVCAALAPQQPVLPPDPVVVHAVGDPLDPTMSQWRRLVGLRRDLGLPAKQITPSSEPAARVLRQQAMDFVREGLRLQLAEPEQVAKLDSAGIAHLLARTRDQFERAAGAHAVGARAVLAVAHEIEAPWIAERALEALPSEDLSKPAMAIEAGLLRDLFAHPSDNVRGEAWRHLLWYCDGCADGDVALDFLARGRRRLQRADSRLQPGQWQPNRRWLPSTDNVLPFRAPQGRAAAELVFCALDGDRQVLDRLLGSGVDSRLILIAHALAAPRVDAAYAKRLYGWYSKDVPAWKEMADGLNQWQYGVLAILVGVLPKLSKDDADRCLCLISGGHARVAAMTVARHRLHRLGPVAASAPWLRLDELPIAALRGADAVQAWRRLGGKPRLSVADCLAFAPADSGADARRQFVTTVLRLAPLQHRDFEVDLARRWVADEDGAVARAALRRGLRGSGDHEPARAGLLRTAAPWCAIECAIEYRSAVPRDVDRAAVPLLADLHAAVVDGRQPRLRELVAALLTDGSGAQLRAALFASRDLLEWTPKLLRLVAGHTTHEDAEVRRAAYVALLSRRDEDRQAGLLAGEAVFDASPVVRALVPRR